MGENHTEAPKHPFEDPEKQHGYKIEAANLYDRVYSMWHKREGELQPQDVIDVFSDPKRKSDLWPDVSLYDVWLMATWRADNLTFGGPKEIPNDPESIAHHTDLVQVAALIENAAKQAGHWPKENPSTKTPK